MTYNLDAEVLFPFTSDYSGEFYGQQIAKLIKKPQKTVSRKLNRFCELGLLEYKKEGKNKYYFLDLDNPLIFNLLVLVEYRKGLRFVLEEEKVGLMLKEIAEERTVVLSGSYAKGYATKESDVDLLVLGRKSKEIEEIVDKYPFEVQIQYSTLDSFEKKLKKKETLAKEIAKNHVVFGYGEEFIKLLFNHFKNE